MTAENVAFGILSALIAVAALRVVTTKNVVHAALFLTVVLSGVAGIYVLVAAEFVAVVQLLVYVGAIVVLFLFGIMLTRAPLGQSETDNGQRGVAAVVALAFFLLLAVVFLQSFDDAKVEPKTVGTAAAVADPIFGQYLMPFEILSVLLLAALVGAVAIARKD